MKKIAVIILAFLMALSVCACGKTETKEITTQQQVTKPKISNPMVESNEERVEKKSGMEFKLPEKATGVTYYVINDEIGQISFDLNKQNYTLRSKKADAADDFSGLYYVWTEEKKVKVNGNDGEVHIYNGEDTECGSLIWFDKDKGSALTLSVDSKTTPDKLVKLAESITK